MESRLKSSMLLGLSNFFCSLSSDFCTDLLSKLSAWTFGINRLGLETMPTKEVGG